MTRVGALDPGTGGLGLVTGESDGIAHKVLDVEVFASAARAPKYSYAQSDDRVRRARELHEWLRPRLMLCDVLLVEAMSFPPDNHAVAMMCLAWGVIVSLIEERRHLPSNVPALFEVQPSRWRSALIGHPSIGKKALTKRGLQEQVRVREREAQLEAVRRFPDALGYLDEVEPSLRVHGMDALGVFAWGVTDLEVRRRLSVGR